MESKSSRKSAKVKSINEIIGARIPPYSAEAESAVLGAMLLDRSAISKAAAILETNSFYNEANKLTFDTILDMYDRQINIDVITLSDELKKRDIYEKINGANYLADLMNATPTAANVDFHIRIIVERFLKRNLILTAGQILENCYDEGVDALDEIDRAEQEIFKLAEKRFINSYHNMNSLAHNALQTINALKEGTGMSGVPSGYFLLDKILGGFQKSDLIIIAARPSMGKTALSLSIARNVALTYKKPVAYFSVEMAADQLLFRLLSAETKINQQQIRTANIKDSEMPKIVAELGKLAEIPLYIDDSPALNLVELKAKCRRLKSEQKIELVMIDYLQLIHVKAESREREISIISRSLKEMAKELNIPVIAMAQLNRAVESRTDKTPMLSDLRESGSIEQDADVVMFINRPEVYKKEFYPEDNSPTEGTAEIIIGKQRNGAIGTIRLAFLKDYARFENLSYMPESYDSSNSPNQNNNFKELDQFEEYDEIGEEPPF